LQGTEFAQEHAISAVENHEIVVNARDTVTMKWVKVIAGLGIVMSLLVVWEFVETRWIRITALSLAWLTVGATLLWLWHKEEE
jgi:hypothetical protein